VADIAVLKDQILSGDYEGHESEIVEAIKLRQEIGAVKFCWRISWGGLDFTEDNLTVGEAQTIEKIVGRSVYYAPPAGSASNLSAYLTAALMHRKDMAEDEATAEVSKAPLKQLLQSISDYTTVEPPKEDGDPASP
jgi:hypothetical protein